MTGKSRRSSTSFKPGQSGNPTGRPVGARNKATMLALAIMEGELDGIVRSVITAAKGGNIGAARLVLEKLVPSAKSRPLAISLPDMTTISGCRDAQSDIIKAMSDGSILPDEAEAISALVEHQRRGLESEQVEARLAAIEEKLGIKGR